MNFDNEATQQGEFYHACRLLGMTAVMELTTPVGRLDVAILNAERTHLLAIVEVKHHEWNFCNGQTAQIQRYKRLGVPVYGLWVGKDSHRLAANIKAAVENAAGVQTAAIDQMYYDKLAERARRKKARQEYRLARFKKFNRV